MSRFSFSFAVRCLCVAALYPFCAATNAQTYPSKPIRFLLPVAPGSTGDTVVRIVAQKMSENVGLPIVVDNKPGAGMVVAATAAKNANADGYTLILAGSGNAVSAAMFKSLPYDILRDFTQVSTLSTLALVIVARPDTGFKSLSEMISHGKSSPGKLNFGIINPGSTQHLGAELFKSLTGINAQLVPYKAAPALVTALRGNEVEIGFEFMPAVLSHIRSNSIKAFGVASDKRFPGLPNIPTTAEGGLAHFQVSSINGVSVLAATSPAIVDRLNREFRAALSSTEVKRRLEELGAESMPSTQKEARDVMESAIARWKKVIEAANIPVQ